MKHLKLFELNQSTYDNFYLKKLKKITSQYNQPNRNYSKLDVYETFHHSCEYGHKEIVEFLLSSPLLDGFDNYDLSYALITSTRNEYVDVVKLLIEDGRFDINAYHFFLVVCEEGINEIMKILLKDSRLDETSINKKNLLESSRFMNHNIVRTLLEDGRVLEDNIAPYAGNIMRNCNRDLKGIEEVGHDYNGKKEDCLWIINFLADMESVQKYVDSSKEEILKYYLINF